MNSINEKIHVTKNIVNIMKDIDCLLSFFKESRIEYCNRLVNRETNSLVKRAHNNL